MPRASLLQRRGNLVDLADDALPAGAHGAVGARPIAAGALYPLFGLLLSPTIAGAAMAFSSVTVVASANRLRSFRPAR